MKTIIDNKPSLIIGFINFESYYVYKWIINSGYVSYYSEKEFLRIRSDQYEEEFRKSKEAYQEIHNKFPIQELQKILYSLGNNSIKTLEKYLLRESPKFCVNSIKPLISMFTGAFCSCNIKYKVKKISKYNNVLKFICYFLKFS